MTDSTKMEILRFLVCGDLGAAREILEQSMCGERELTEADVVSQIRKYSGIFDLALKFTVIGGMYCLVDLSTNDIISSGRSLGDFMSQMNSYFAGYYAAKDRYC